MNSPDTQNTLVSQSPPRNSAKYPEVPFRVVTQLFEKLTSERRPDIRRKVLSVWFNHWRQEIGNDLYPALRLILPQKDRERSVYGLKEKNLAKAYIKLIPLNMKDPDAVRLLNWKRPTDRNKAAGDFPTVLYEVISKRSSVTQSTLKIEALDKLLDKLSKETGKQEVQSKILQRIYNETTSEDQMWIARIILKDMQINMKENTVFSVIHPDALDLFNTCSDLKRVAHDLYDPSRRLEDEDKQITLFRNFAPMLCKRPTARLEDSLRGMEGKTFIIEEKLDGERMQLHKRGGNYFFCSRKGKDYTYLYGADDTSGSLTPYIKDAFDERIEELILDGEMLVWDPVSERNLPFGTLKTAAINKPKSILNPRPCFKVFDLLYLNGNCLAQKSLKYRKRNLHAYVKEIKGRLEFVTGYEGRTVHDVRSRLEEVVENRGEGLIIKHPLSEYVLNGRNVDWVKVKPEYMEDMSETVDLVVVAGNYGTGKRSGGVSTLICAVLDDRRMSIDDEEMKYSTFVRIGTGLTYADYVWIRQKNWKTLDKNNLPSWYQAAKRSIDDKGDVYLEPEDSFLLKVKAAEITPSDQYHLGFTMRFPRAVSIREDLSIAECMTATAVLESLKSERKRKMEDTEQTEKKKKRKIPKKPITIMPEYRGEKMKDIEVKSDIFDGLTFMVASDPKNRDGEAEKQSLVKLIRSNGGKIVQIAKGLDPILIVYGGTTIPYDLKLVMNKDIHDIIRPSWIYDCVDGEEQVPLYKKYFFHATSERQLDSEYNAGTDDDTHDDNTFRSAEKDEQAQEGITTVDEPEKKSSFDPDPALADWFKVDSPGGSTTKSTTVSNEEDSETEPDSDYDEIRFEGETDEWVSVDPAEQSESVASTMEGAAGDEAEVKKELTPKMGEDITAMEYDTEKIFKHLCFYLDSPSNAERHGMDVKPKHKDQITKSLASIEHEITTHGGRVVSDLSEPKLTHIILDKRDTSRRKELMQRTSQPKRRKLVLSDYISACIEEDSLLDEESFAP